jgi:hypothetical protein
VLLAVGLTGCGQLPVTSSASTTVETGAQAYVSTAARDKIAKTLINEYNGIQWYQDADRKKQLLEAIVGTGSDLAVDLLLNEYNSIQWYQDKDRKMMFLTMLEKLASTPDSTPKQSLTKVTSPTGKPSTKALAKVGVALQDDLAKAPSDAKPKMQAIIKKVLIISPNTGR